MPGEWEAAPHLYRYAHLYAMVGVRLLEKGATPITPDVVDTWESWQAAGFLGHGIPEGDGAGSGRDIATERAEYLYALAQGENPEPPKPDTPTAPSPEFLAAFTQQG